MDNEMFQQAEQFRQRALDTLTRNSYATQQARTHLRNDSVDGGSRGIGAGADFVSSRKSEAG